MVWFSIAVGVIGIVLLVPSVLQSVDGNPPHIVYGFVAFAASTFGLAGAFASQFATGWGTNLIAAMALGLAAGAVHPELVAWLGRRHLENAASCTESAPDAEMSV